MSTELVLSNENGIKIHNPNGTLHVVFMSGGMCSSYMLRDLCINYKNEPNQICYITICNLNKYQIQSVENIVSYYQQHYPSIRFIPIEIKEDFNNIEEWLPKFIRDTFDKYLFHKIRIVFGFASDRINEIHTGDDEIDSMIVYPLKDKYEYYRIFKRTVDFATSTYRWLTICSDPKEDGKPCLVCRDCLELKNNLMVCAMTYPKEFVTDFCKQMYEETFGEAMVTENMAIIADEQGNTKLVNTDEIDNLCGYSPIQDDGKIKYIPRSRT